MTQTELLTIAVGILLILALVVGLLALARWRRATNKGLQSLIQTVSRDCLVDIIIPDGAGGQIHIDHLLLTPHGLMLLETKDMQGAVFAGERMNTWTATHGGVRLAFDNPISTLQERAAAVGLLAPGVPIAPRVLFVNEVTFPKGHPPNVSTVSSLIEEYRSIDTSDEPSDLHEHWRTIKSAVMSSNDALG